MMKQLQIYMVALVVNLANVWHNNVQLLTPFSIMEFYKVLMMFAISFMVKQLVLIFQIGIVNQDLEVTYRDII
jgi:hypothetical protein